MSRFLILFIFSLLFSSAAYADSSVIGLFDPPASDRSLYYLSMIFGTVGTVLDGSSTGNPLLGHMFRFFNTSVFIVGILFISLAAIVSIIRMGAEGAILGRQVSNLWVPVRAGIGLLILSPTASGYSFIQVLAMWVIINGVGAADAIWSVMLNHTFNKADVSAIETAVDGDFFKHILRVASCQELFNSGNIDRYASRSDYLDSPNGVQLHLAGNKMLLMGPVQDGKAQDPLCGGFVLDFSESREISSNANATLLATFAHLSAYKQALRDIYAAAYEIVNVPQGEWQAFGAMHSARTLLMEGLAQNLTYESLQLPNPHSTDEIHKAAREDGWIHAGSFYFTLMTATRALSTNLFTKPPVIHMNLDSFQAAIDSTSAGTEAYDELNRLVDSYWDEYVEYKTEYERQAAAGQERSEGKLYIPSSGNTNVMGMSILPDVTPLTMKIINAVTHNSPDPLYSLSTVGIWAIQIIESMWISSIILAFTLTLVGAIMNCTIGGGDSMKVVVEIMAILMNLVMVLFWGGAVMLGIYVPMIPYVIYLVASIGWMILVVEAITAAPLVALGFVTPNQEELGKSGHGVMLLTNVFMRPMLMVIGFAAATELVQIMAKVISYGFQSTLSSQVGATTVIGALAVMGIYVGIILSVANECFSLIYVLPDRLMRWIGMQPESSTAERALKQFKQKTDEAGQSSQQLGQGVAQFMSKQMGVGTEKGGSSGAQEEGGEGEGEGK